MRQLIGLALLAGLAVSAGCHSCKNFTTGVCDCCTAPNDGSQPHAHTQPVLATPVTPTAPPATYIK
jgi:hypothetical protein